MRCCINNGPICIKDLIYRIDDNTKLRVHEQFYIKYMVDLERLNKFTTIHAFPWGFSKNIPIVKRHVFDFKIIFIRHKMSTNTIN
jgi:hypothetical protein